MGEVRYADKGAISMPGQNPDECAVLADSRRVVLLAESRYYIVTARYEGARSD